MLNQKVTDALKLLVDQKTLSANAVKALELVALKGQDYNRHIPRDAYFPMGLPSYAQMLHIKSMRLVNLSMSKDATNFESVEDSAIDLFNYCHFLLEYLDKRPENEKLP